MDKNMKLIDSKNNCIARGEILRVKGKYPYEELVDFMVFETMEKNTPYGLMVTSGYKAGLILVYLPEVSNVSGGLDKNWVVSNWKQWIYPDCDVSEVCLIDGYAAK
jgi:hypothetical protein